MIEVLFVLAALQAPPLTDTITIENVVGEFDQVFSIRTFPPNDAAPTDIGVTVRSRPEGPYLGAFQREYPWLLTYLVQRGLSVDLMSLRGAEPSPNQWIAAAREAMRNDAEFTNAVGTFLAPFLAMQGLHLGGYTPITDTTTYSLEELEAVGVRFFYPDRVLPDGNIGAHICTEFNAVDELGGRRSLLADAFVFAAIRGNLGEVMPEFEKAMSVAARVTGGGDPATVVARAQGVVWGHLVNSGVVRRILMREYEARKAYLPVTVALK